MLLKEYVYTYVAISITKQQNWS